MATYQKCAHGKSLDDRCMACEKVFGVPFDNRDELTRLRSRVKELEGALGDIAQRLNESGTGEMGLLETIHATHAIARTALQVKGE